MKKTRFTVILVSAFAAGVLGSFTTSSAEAASGNCTYYSDASHTTVVGRYGKDCCNNTVATGHKTQYSVCGGCFICFPPPAE